MVDERIAKLLDLAEQYDREGRTYVAAKLRVAAQEALDDRPFEWLQITNYPIKKGNLLIKKRKANGGKGWTPP